MSGIPHPTEWYRKTMLEYVSQKREKWSPTKRKSFCTKCYHNKNIIDINLDFEDHYDSLWNTLVNKEVKTDTIDFCQQYLKALQWLNKNEHRQIVVLNFAYFDFAFIQKIYRAFFLCTNAQYQIRIGMLMIDALQSMGNTYSLDADQRSNLITIQDGAFGTWYEFWSNEPESHTFFHDKLCSWNVPNKQPDTLDEITFCNIVLEWIDKQMDRLKSIFFSDDLYRVRREDHNMFVCILTCLMKLISDAGNVQSYCLTDKSNEDTTTFDSKGKYKNKYITPATVLKRVIHLTKKLTTVVQQSNNAHLINILKRTYAIVGQNQDLHPHVVRLLVTWIHKISAYQHYTDYLHHVKPLARQQSLAARDGVPSSAESHAGSPGSAASAPAYDPHNPTDFPATVSEPGNADRPPNSSVPHLSRSFTIPTAIDLMHSQRRMVAQQRSDQNMYVLHLRLFDLPYFHSITPSAIKKYPINSDTPHATDVSRPRHEVLAASSASCLNVDRDECKTALDTVMADSLTPINRPSSALSQLNVSVPGKVGTAPSISPPPLTHPPSMKPERRQFIESTLQIVRSVLKKRKYKILYTAYTGAETDNNDEMEPSTIFAMRDSSDSNSSQSSNAPIADISPIANIKDTTADHSTNRSLLRAVDPYSPHRTMPVTMDGKAASPIRPSDYDTTNSTASIPERTDPISTIDDSTLSSPQLAISSTIVEYETKTTTVIPAIDHDHFDCGRILVMVDASHICRNIHDEDKSTSVTLSKDTVMMITAQEIMDRVDHGIYRLQLMFYPANNSCKHRFDGEYFVHQSLSLRNFVGDADPLTKSVLALALQKRAPNAIQHTRFVLLYKLKYVLQMVLPSAEFEIFGSMAACLDHKDSDLDISVHLPAGHEFSREQYNEAHKDTPIIALPRELENNRIKAILGPLQAALKREKSFQVNYYDHASVPIIKIIDKNSGLQSDISVARPESSFKTKLLKKYVNIDWRVRPLVLAIKQWAKTRSMADSYRGSLNSFGFTLLIIHYLQTRNPPILPVLKVDESNLTQKYEWEKPAQYINYGMENRMSLGGLYKGFFMYYNDEFHANDHSISISADRLLNKNNVTLRSNQNRVLIVLDPCDSTDNVARRVTTATCHKMADEFRQAVHLLSNQN